MLFQDCSAAILSPQAVTIKCPWATSSFRGHVPVLESTQSPYLQILCFLPFPDRSKSPLFNGPSKFFSTCAHLDHSQFQFSLIYLGRKYQVPTVWGDLGYRCRAKWIKNNELPCSHYQKSELELDPCAQGGDCWGEAGWEDLKFWVFTASLRANLMKKYNEKCKVIKDDGFFFMTLGTRTEGLFLWVFEFPE